MDNEIQTDLLAVGVEPVENGWVVVHLYQVATRSPLKDSVIRNQERWVYTEDELPLVMEHVERFLRKDP